MANRFFNIICILFSFGLLQGQWNAIDVRFRHFTTEDGLSNNSVYSFLKDDLGFIWIGTRNGLNRYDGYDFKTFTSLNSPLRGDYIADLEKGCNSNIWIGTKSSGLYRYDVEKDSLIYVLLGDDPSESSSNNKINSIFRSKDDIIWIGTNGGGLFSIDCQSNISKYHELGDELRRIRVLNSDADGNLWIGTYNGLFYYEKARGHIARIMPAEPGQNISSNDRITALHVDQTGRLWVGTDGSGLYYLEKSTLLLKKFKSDRPELQQSIVREIVSSPEGQIIIGSGRNGVLVLDPISQAVTIVDNDPENNYSLSNNSVYGLMLDDYGSLWVGNYFGGINFYNRFDRKFHTERDQRSNPQSLSNSDVRSFYQDSNGDIWIGTRNGLNLQLKDGNGYMNFSIISEQDDEVSHTLILTMYEDSKGRFLIGTFTGGIKIFDRQSHTVKQFNNPNDINNTLERSSVYDMVEDKSSSLWIATLGGVYVIDKEDNLKRYSINDSSFIANVVKVLLRDSRDQIWLGTSEGLVLYNESEQSFELYAMPGKENSKNPHSQVLCLYESGNGTIWAGTEGGGLLLIDQDKDTVKLMGIEDGLAGNTIYSLEEDHDGVFWISTNKGLSKYDPVENSVINFTREDGLQSNEFYPNSSLFSAEGDMYFGGVNGLNRFRTSNIQINPHLPKVVFTDLFIKNQAAGPGAENSPLKRPIYLCSEIKLNYKQSNITLHYAALGYINPEKYQYSTFLRGFDDDWSPFSSQRSATYTNLNRGNYVFEVQVKNNDSLLSEEITRLNIEVLPPPWLAWWAYALYIALIAVLLLLFRHYIISWNNVQNQLQFEKREKSQIQELNQMKLSFFTNISHEFRTPLTLLNGHLDSLSTAINSKKASYALEQLYRNSKRLLRLVDELMDFRQAENGLLKLKTSEGDIIKFSRDIANEFGEVAMEQGIVYSFQTEYDSLRMWFDPGKVEKILFNLISNAFKNTPLGGEITVSVSDWRSKSESGYIRSPFPNRNENRWIEIGVHDTGIGIPEKDQERIFERFFQVQPNDRELGQGGSGVGLAFSKRLAEIHKGDLTFKSKISEGSSFLLRLLVGENHLLEEEKYITEEERFYLRLDYKTRLGDSFGNDSISNPDVSPGKPEVLIIDDDLQIISLLKDVLSNKYNLKFSIEAKAGLKMIKEGEPDIVVTDLMMPGMSGIELCTALKENPVTSHIPVVILTAKSSEESRLEGLYSGADAYISKPFSTKVLIATIENILNSRKLLREKFAEMDTIAPSDLTRAKIDEQFLQSTINYIENNLSDASFDVVSLCKNIGISRSVLYRKIKALTGHSIQEFIRSVKLRRAKYLLITTDKTISEVSYLVGFSNTKYFSTSFKKEFEISPSEFRK